MALEKIVEQLREMLGAAKDATAEVVASSLKARLDELAGLRADRVAVCKALAVSESARGDELVVAINAAKKPAASTEEIGALTRRVEKAEGEAKAANDALAQIKADERIRLACSQGKLTNADLLHAEDGPFYKKLAHDERAWAAFFDRLPAKAPADGVLVTSRGGAVGPVGGDRIAVINRAKGEWRGSKDLQGWASLEAFVCSELNEEKMLPTLSEDEKKLVAA